MKKTGYDEQGARTLLPMLRSIMNELRERGHAIDELERVLARSSQTDAARRTEALNAVAALAVHRRGLHLATQELERLGCTVDDDHPQRIRIPGATGDKHAGFVWDAADDELELRPALASAASG